MTDNIKLESNYNLSLFYDIFNIDIFNIDIFNNVLKYIILSECNILWKT